MKLVTARFARVLAGTLCTAALLLLAGCPGTVMRAKKAEGYDKSVSALTVLYLDRQRIDVQLGDWATAEGWLKEKHFFEFPTKLEKTIPAAFAHYGVNAKLEKVSALPETLDSYAPGHVLILDPFQCISGHTGVSVTYAVTLYEPGRAGNVWEAHSLSSAAMLTSYDEGQAQAVSEKLAKALAKDGLLGKPQS